MFNWNRLLLSWESEMFKGLNNSLASKLAAHNISISPFIARGNATLVKEFLF